VAAADVTQREGRILREGNRNAEVRILRYVTEGSFDAYTWQTVTRKAKFIRMQCCATWAHPAATSEGR